MSGAWYGADSRTTPVANAETARSWFNYLRQGETWVPANGQPIKITDMTPDWRANAARWLLRRASTAEFYFTVAELVRVQLCMSENAEDALVQEIDQRADDPEAWLKTTALYQALVSDQPAEVQR